MPLCNDSCTCLDFEAEICSPCVEDPEVVSAHTAEATEVALAHNADGTLTGIEDTNATGAVPRACHLSNPSMARSDVSSHVLIGKSSHSSIAEKMDKDIS